MRRLRLTSQRPERFSLDPRAPLANGLMVFGGGQSPGTTVLRDDSLWRGDLALNNFTGSYLPSTEWVWMPTIGRWGLRFTSANATYVSRAMKVPGIIDSVSLAAWFQPSSLAGYGGIGSWDATHNADGRSWGSLGLNNSNIFRFRIQSDTAEGQASSAVVSAGVLHHLCGVWKSGICTIYMDGIAQATTASVSGNFSGMPRLNFEMGRLGAYWNGTYAYNGLIADASLWKRALSPDEIKALADPCNVMLAVGTAPLLRSTRRILPVAVTPPVAGVKFWVLQSRSIVIGGGVL